MSTETVQTRQVRIDDIEIASRIRKENGDITALAESIQTLGLIHPITVMERPDDRYLLIAGLRRLEACRSLGDIDIRSTVLTATDADELLMLEIAENEQRQQFSTEERLDYRAKIEGVEKEKARQRKSQYARAGRDENQDMRNCARPEEQGEKGNTRDIIAKKAGFTSSRQMERAQLVAQKRPDLLKKIDSGETSINAAYEEARKPDDAQGVPSPTVQASSGASASSKEERERVKRFERQVVIARPVERHVLDLINPATIAVAGDPSSLAGTAHDGLLKNPVYATMYEKYKEAVREANAAYGKLYTDSENYEKRIRAYEENRQTMARTIEKLQGELNALREAQHVGA